MSSHTKYPELQKVASALRQALVIIERFEHLGDRQSLPDRIVDALEMAQPLSTGAIRDLVRRKAYDVRATLALLQETGRITRGPRGWELIVKEAADGTNN